MEGLEFLAFGLFAVPIGINVYAHYAQKRHTQEIVDVIKSRKKVYSLVLEEGKDPSYVLIPQIKSGEVR